MNQKTKKIAFLATCPKCLQPATQEHSQSDLKILLNDKKLEFYCATCDHHWTPTVQEKANLGKFLTQQNNAVL